MTETAIRLRAGPGVNATARLFPETMADRETAGDFS